MWLSDEFVDWFKISQDTVTALREENSKLKAENDLLRVDLLTTRANFKWLTTRVNTLEYQNTALLEKAYDIKVPAPAIVEQPKVDPTFNPKDFSFDDIGDDMAKRLGLPVYTN